jgi:hypothetical protein
MAYLTWIPWRSTLPLFLRRHSPLIVLHSHALSGLILLVEVFDFLMSYHIVFAEHATNIEAIPQGQAFALMNGAELYKIRIPLPKNDALVPNDIKQIITQINHQQTRIITS